MNDHKPLASRFRPDSWNDLKGIPQLESPESPLYAMKASGLAKSCIFYGPPGCGKTTLARILARMQKSNGGTVHKGTGGEITKKTLDEIVKESRAQIPKEGELELSTQTPPPLLFIDEIHRLSKVQSEFLLASTEEGELILIGATTENPYISLGPAMLSRCPVVQLEGYTKDDLINILNRTFIQASAKKLPGTGSIPDKEIFQEIARLAGGDSRTALNLLERALTLRPAIEDTKIPGILREQIAPMSTRMDDFGDIHYDVTSAFIKSMRGSSPDAAMHWLARLMDGGVDPRYIARRIAIHASEDVGMADPMALVVANAALQAVEKIGYPECRLTLAQAAMHVALSPKSPAVYQAIGRAQADLAAGFQPPVPNYLADTHYKGAAKLGHQGYDHPGQYPGGRHPQGEGHHYLPGLETPYWVPNENDEHTLRKNTNG